MEPRLGASRAWLGKVASASWGSIVYSVCQAVALAIISRQGGADDAGLFLLAQSIATPLALFYTFRLRDQIGTSNEGDLVRSYLRRQFWFIFPTLVVAAPLWLVLGTGRTAVIGWLILVGNLAQSALRTVQGGLLRTERFTLTSSFDATMGALSVAGTFVGYVIAGMQLAMFLVSASWVLVVSYVVIRWSSGSWREDLPTTVRADVVMGLSAMGAIAQISLGRLGTSYELGREALARVGAGSFAVRATQPMFRGVLKVNTTRLARARLQGHSVLDAVERRSVQVICLGTVVALPIFFVVGFFLGPWMIEIAFGEEVVPSDLTTAIIWAAAPLLYASMALSQMLVARQAASAATRVSFTAMVVTGLTVLPLASRFGEPGAASAILLGYLTRCVVAIYLLNGIRGGDGRSREPVERELHP